MLDKLLSDFNRVLVKIWWTCLGSCSFHVTCQSLQNKVSSGISSVLVLALWIVKSSVSHLCVYCTCYPCTVCKSETELQDKCAKTSSCPGSFNGKQIQAHNNYIVRFTHSMHCQVVKVWSWLDSTLELWGWFPWVINKKPTREWILYMLLQVKLWLCKPIVFPTKMGISKWRSIHYLRSYLLPEWSDSNRILLRAVVL